MTKTTITQGDLAKLQTAKYEKSRPLKEVIMLLMSNQMAINRQLDGACTAETIVKRLYHDQLVAVNEKVFNKELSLWERVKEYAKSDHDEAYGKAIACLFGMRLPNGVKYDVNQYKGDMTLVLRGEERYAFMLYLRTIGGKPINEGIDQYTDGINHINIYSKGRTALGKVLSMFHSMGDRCYGTKAGIFMTLEGLYHYLRIKDYYEHLDGKVITEWFKDPRLTDSKVFVLRRADGATAIRYGRELKSSIYGGTSYRPQQLSKTSMLILIDALLRKLTIDFNGVCLWKTLKLVLSTDMTLEHYYVHDGEVKTPPHAMLLPDLYTTIMKFVDPEDTDFDILSLTDKVEDIYELFMLESSDV